MAHLPHIPAIVPVLVHRDHPQRIHDVEPSERRGVVRHPPGVAADSPERLGAQWELRIKSTYYIPIPVGPGITPSP